MHVAYLPADEVIVLAEPELTDELELELSEPDHSDFGPTLDEADDFIYTNDGWYRIS